MPWEGSFRGGVGIGGYPHILMINEQGSKTLHSPSIGVGAWHDRYIGFRNPHFDTVAFYLNYIIYISMDLAISPT